MNELLNVAQRIFDIDRYNAMDSGETPESIAESIAKDPIPAITYLLDIIEDLQA